MPWPSSSYSRAWHLPRKENCEGRQLSWVVQEGFIPSPPPPPTTLVPMGLLTGRQLPRQSLQLQVLGGLGEFADLPALLVHEVDGDSLAGDEQRHQDGERGEGGFAPQPRPAGHGQGAQPTTGSRRQHPDVTQSQTLLSLGFAARQMQIPPSKREVKPQQELSRSLTPPHQEPKPNCGGGGKWGHGRGTERHVGGDWAKGFWERASLWASPFEG